MKPAAFDYIRPKTLAEAAAVLATSGSAKLLAGGQSLGPMLNLRLVRPALLIDISRIEELLRIEETAAAWRIGAGVTHAQIEDAGTRLRGAEILSVVAGEIAYRSIRNRGTIGGSLAHADPAGDWPLTLAALDARVTVRGPDGRSRSIPANEFMQAAFVTMLKPDEIIVSVEVAKRSAAARYGYFKFCRKAGDFPEVSAAVLLDPEAGHARVFIGALATAPRPLPDIAGILAKQDAKAITEDVLADGISAALPNIDAVDRRMRVAALWRAVEQVLPR
ncbi:MAG: carbon monoxide dehydrogenase [Pseudolabrys sp.]|nr:carbon monoxide dehydrogenase [Pseudolabrys sp.]